MARKGVIAAIVGFFVVAIGTGITLVVTRKPAAKPPAAPTAALPSGAAGWSTRISQASTMSDLDAVRSEFESAYTSGKLDQATYLALYKQYQDRSNAIQAAAAAPAGAKGIVTAGAGAAAAKPSAAAPAPTTITVGAAAPKPSAAAPTPPAAPTMPPSVPTATLIAYRGPGGGLYLRYAKPEDLARALVAGWRQAVVNVDYSPGDEVGVPYWGTGDFGYPKAAAAPTPPAAVPTTITVGAGGAPPAAPPAAPAAITGSIQSVAIAEV